MIKYDNPKDFYSCLKESLKEQESRYNMLFGIAYNLMLKKEELNCVFLSCSKGSEFLLIPNLENARIIISEISDENILKFSNHLKSLSFNLKTIVGPKKSVDKLGQALGGEFRVQMNQGIYECDTPIIPSSKGQLISYDESKHSKLIHEYVRGFIGDCFVDMDEKELEIEVKHSISSFTKFSDLIAIYFLEVDGELVSLVGKIRETESTSCISYVYTPVHFRKKGYASLAVALLSKKLIDSGKKAVNLHTDLENPTSNKIYQDVGYRSVGDALCVSLVKD